MEDIAGYIDHPLWDAFTAFVDESYGAKPRIEYSRCGGAPGWNVKYKARGRALCTVYPRDGFFICMVSVGSKEKDEAEALLAGIMLDTRSFVMKAGVRTFEAAAYLRRQGADTVEVKRMFSESAATYRKKADIVSRAEIYRRTAIAYDEDGGTEVRIAAAQAADELLSIKGVDAAFTLFTDGDFFRGFRIGPGGAAGAQKLLDRENSVPGSGLGGRLGTVQAIGHAGVGGFGIIPA